MPMPSQPWRDALQPASFRGVGFFVEVGGIGTGRRNVTHQFPKSDTPFTEDMGRMVRRWPITGYVIGPDYLEDRDALIAACEAGGPGTLVHPTLGEMLVNCGPIATNESRERGGMCIFEMPFVEAGALPDDSVSDDTQGSANSAADTLGNSAASSFDKNETISI